MRLIRVHPKVASELSKAAAWYERAAEGLGQEFEAAFRQTVEEITRDPERQHPLFDTYRRWLVKRFPYAIYYAVDPDTIFVLHLTHGKRNPRRLRRILNSRFE